jgi:Secretion system C-terminal sorting domain
LQITYRQKTTSYQIKSTEYSLLDFFFFLASIFVSLKPLFMKLSLLTIASAFAMNTYSQAPTIQWQKNLTGSAYNTCYSTIQTSDGGYVATGASNSIDSYFTGNKGDMDGWVAKLDASGAVIWNKNLGGSSQDQFYCIAQCTDGGFIAAGYVKSNDGDVSGNHGNQYGPYFEDDCWVVKLDPNGNILWQKTLGGAAAEQVWSIKETADGGCILAATSSSMDGDISNHHGTDGAPDYWIIKLDVNGNTQWEHSFGGSDHDYCFSIDKTSDGGYIIAGSSSSTDDDVTPLSSSFPDIKCWIIKLDANGTLSWEKSFLVEQYFTPKCIQQTSDGGYIIAGSSSDFSDNDGAVLKLDQNGLFQWEKTFGGTSYDRFNYIEETTNGGYIISGSTESNNGDISNFYGGVNDCWIVNIDVNGNLLWEKTYGGSGDDEAYSIRKTNDNGYIVSTISSSSNHDVNATGYNSYNAWIFKLIPLSTGITENQPSNTFSIYPNPANDIIHINASASVTNESYSIVNTLGQTVLNGKLENERSTIDVQTLQAGIYFLQIGDKQTQSYKIIKN